MTARALAPEHWADLRKSGLSDDTIAGLQFEAVPPGKLKLPGCESAYRLPYFNIDGSRTDFERWKVFPPIKTTDGHNQKYTQEKGSAPALYLPALCSWAAVARNSKTELLICEGEKKAARATQEGLITAGVAGLWSWRERLDSGERITLPIFDRFVWKDRPTLLVPDSDTWRPGKEQALLGFYGLAQELVSRGAAVSFLKLPETGSTKTGLDDWFEAAGGDWPNVWPLLERVPLDDARLNPVAALWQRWREKHATVAAIKAHDLDEPEVEEAAGLYSVRLPAHQVRLTFDRLEQHRGTPHADVSVHLGGTVLLDGIDLSLKSDTAQSRLVTTLKSYAPAIPWRIVLQKACAAVVRRARRGSPPITLCKSTPVEPLTYSVNPLVMRRKPTVLYSDGGKGKSTFALLLAMAVSIGATVAGFRALRGRALYLDYEDDSDVHARRLRALQAGHPELLDAHVDYLRCTEPLWQITRDLARLVQETGVSFVVLDSIMAATGGDSSTEAVGKLFAALRVLNCDTLLIGHTPKTLPEGQDHASIYGSVFNSNFSRSVWELKNQQEVGADSAVLGLFCRKSNLARKHEPLGLRVTYSEAGDFVRYESTDLAAVAELAAALPLHNRIRNLLEDGTPRTSRDIAEALNSRQDSVKVTLSRHRGRKWASIGEGNDVLWTVLSR